MPRDHPASWDELSPFSNLTGLEMAWGTPIGADASAFALQPDSSVSARSAFRAVVRGALARPPCIVSFSGGRDSSVVLAVAADVARQEGLALPIPVTHRFPEVADAKEDDWQELVVRHLALPDWQVLDWTDEMDVIGPIAQRTLRLLGATSPSNQHFLLPVIEYARGGSVLTGTEGDELFELRTRPVASRWLYGPDRKVVREFPGFVAGTMPGRLRAARLARAGLLDYKWIRADARRELERRFARWLHEAPLRYDHGLLRWHWPSRITQYLRRQLATLGLHHDVAVEHPFGAPAFLTALAAEVGGQGPAGRARLLRTVAGELLPPEVFTRVAKAGFGSAFYARHTRTFARDWNGSGVDESMIDAAALREEWLADRPAPQTLVLLQAAYLAGVESGQ